MDKSAVGYSNLEKIRLKKLETLRAEGIDPYPTRAKRTHLNQDAVKAFEAEESTGSEELVIVTLVGRLRAVRSMGKITFFYTISFLFCRDINYF